MISSNKLTSNNPGRSIMSTKTETAPKASRRQAELITNLLELEASVEALQELINDTKDRLVRSVGIGGTVEVEGLAQVTVVQQTTAEINFDDLVLAHPAWARKVTKKVFDRKKFGLLRNAGVVPQSVLDMVTEKTTSPFLRVTLRSPKEV